MTGHLFESTLILASAILLAQLPQFAARTRHAIVFTALMKFAVPSAIVPRLLALLGLDLTRVPRGTIVIEALGPLSGGDGAATPVSPWPALFLALWLVVAVGFLVRTLHRGRVALRRALADGCDATPGEHAALLRALARADVTRRVRLVRSKSITAPATAGMLRPVIFIPDPTRLSSAELETILTHECAHIGRHDNLFSLVESVAGCALWFHPLVWIARRILDATREEACDATVISSGNPETYIDALRKVCEAAIAPRAAAVSCIVSNTLRERMEAIMRFGSRRVLNHRAIMTMVLAVFVASTIGVGVARALPGASSEERTPRFQVSTTVVRDSHSEFKFSVVVRDHENGEASTFDFSTPPNQWYTRVSGTVDANGKEHEFRLRGMAQDDGTARLEITIDQGPTMVQTLTIGSTEKIPATVSAEADSSGGRILRVGGDVKAPVVISRVEPVFTPLAKESKISGIVILEIVVDHTGVVKDARVVKPLPFGLDQAALDAVKQWVFRPATLNGKAVDVIFNITMNFRPDHGDPNVSRTGENARAGQPISIDLKDADIRDVMKTFAQLANTEILVDDDVHGSVTVTLHETPWTEALDRILADAGLRSERAGNTIRVHRK